MEFASPPHSNSDEEGEDDDSVDDESMGDMFPVEDGECGVGGQTTLSKRGAPADAEVSSKKRRKLMKSNELKKLHKPPTVEELNRLRETENLFHSNLFRRQIEEMLKELEISDKFKVKTQTWFSKLRDWVMKIEDGSETYNLLESNWSHNIKMPIADFNDPIKAFYQFKKPSNISVFGSFECGTMTGPGAIDVHIDVPTDFFQKEDYLNSRYHRKRAMYLYEIGRHIESKGDLVRRVNFCANDGESWTPCLEVVPADKLGDKFTFLLHLAPEKNTFKLHRFMPTKNNVRARWALGKDIESEQPTPMYNSTILKDILLMDNHVSVAKLIEKSSQLRDAIILLKVWTRQRELHAGQGSLNGFMISALLSYLLKIRKLNSTMSSYQIIRTTWNYLKTCDWENSGITLCDAAPSDHQPSLSDFHSHYPVVFVDPSGFLNLCAGVSQPAFRRWKEESAMALRCLDIPEFNSFQVLFMTPVPFFRLADQNLLFHKFDAVKKILEKRMEPERKVDIAGMTHYQVLNILIPLLTRGLGDRISSMYVKLSPRRTWAMNKKPRPSSTITIGFALDPDNCFRLVDKVLETDSAQSGDFQKFWGDRAELRRFKDGSITDAVVWSAKTWQEKRLISRQIVDFVLAKKCGLNRSDYRYIADNVESVLPNDFEFRAGTVISSFDLLNKHLRGLNDLPLDVVSVQGISPVFRYTDAFPPRLPKSRNDADVEDPADGGTCPCEKISDSLTEAPAWCSPAEVLIQLGGSNKWPKDVEAIRRIRAAFNIKIAELLKANHRLVTHPSQNGVDVLMRNCVYRLKIVYPGEIALMKKCTGADGIVHYKDTDESIKLERESIHLPKISSALHGLHSQHNSFGTSCCLAKRWIRSHMFDESHISDVAIELIMAAVYLNPEPWKAPNQPQVAFQRFLHTLGTTNWSLQFILINFNEELKREDIHEIQTHFDSVRSTLPPLFIATPYDTKRSVWTRHAPLDVVLFRLTRLAQGALDLLEKSLWDPTPPEIKLIFESSLKAYDIVINLNSSFVPRKCEAISEMRKAVQDFNVSSNKKIPVVAFDTVEKFVNELRVCYDEWALFFYDPYGGASIGMLWKPAATVIHEFKVTRVPCTLWDRKSNNLHLNKEGIIEGISILGGTLVNSVDVR